jgi:hypothetical protein
MRSRLRLRQESYQEEGGVKREEQGGSGWADAAPSRGRCIILGPESKLLIEDRERSNHAGK